MRLLDAMDTLGEKATLRVVVLRGEVEAQRKTAMKEQLAKGQGPKL